MINKSRKEKIEKTSKQSQSMLVIRCFFVFAFSYSLSSRHIQYIFGFAGYTKEIHLTLLYVFIAVQKFFLLVIQSCHLPNPCLHIFCHLRYMCSKKQKNIFLLKVFEFICYRSEQKPSKKK